MSTTNRKENNSIRIDEKIKGLYKILAASSKQVDQESWTLDQEISWLALNEYLGLKVVPGELVPYETCMRIVGEFTALGLDWDDIPKEGLGLMELIDTIKNHIVPTTSNLTMKSEYLFSTHCSQGSGEKKHYLSGNDIKGIHLKAGRLNQPNAFGVTYPGSEVGNRSGLNIKTFVTDIENVDLNDLWAGNTTASIRGEQINQDNQLDESTDPILSQATELYLTRRRQNKYLHNLEHIPDAFPDAVYSEEQLAQYTIRPWLTPLESTEVGISVLLDGVILHPRHWRYAAGNGLIVFMDNTIHTGSVEVNLGLLGESKALWFLPKWMREGKHGPSERSTWAYKLSDEYLELLQADIDAGTMKVYVIEPRVSPSATEWRSAIEKLLSENGKVTLVDSLSGNNSKVAIAGRGMTKHILKYGISGGIPVGNIDILSSYSNAMTTNQKFDTCGFESGAPEAVKGNSRQKIIDNGKISWPAAKSRKGNRKIK